MVMEIKDYQEQAARTNAILEKQVYDGEGQCEKLSENIHMTLGMVTETAELADVFKKHLAYNKDVDWVNVKEELGDLMWYIANMCNINGWDLRDIMQTNINKLQLRYPEKFTTNKAINRDLNAERSELEK